MGKYSLIRFKVVGLIVWLAEMKNGNISCITWGWFPQGLLRKRMMVNGKNDDVGRLSIFIRLFPSGAFYYVVSLRGKSADFLRGPKGDGRLGILLRH